MADYNQRRFFLKSIVIGGAGATLVPTGLLQAQVAEKKNGKNKATSDASPSHRKYNAPYKGENLNRLAFPIGGLGAGMFCMEGTGAISHMSVRNKPDIYNEPSLFAAIAIKEVTNGVKVLEGPVPDWKMFGARGTGNGAAGTTYGLPRFGKAEFTTRFPFGTVQLQDADIPMKIELKAWSPFIPTDEDNSSIPAGAIEYSFTNRETKAIDAVFSFNSKNFLINTDGAVNKITATRNGFVLKQEAIKDKPEAESSFAIFTDDDNTVVDHCWFRGGWWDPLTMAWNTVRDGKTRSYGTGRKRCTWRFAFCALFFIAWRNKNNPADDCLVCAGKRFAHWRCCFKR